MTDTQSVVIERTLDAPIELVWKMWAEAEHFAAVLRDHQLFIGGNHPGRGRAAAGADADIAPPVGDLIHLQCALKFEKK